MRHLIDAAQHVARRESGAAPHAHAFQLAGLVVHGDEAGRVDDRAARVASHVHVDVGQRADRQSLVDLAEGIGAQRIQHLAVGDRHHLLPDVAAHVQAVVEVVARLALAVAAVLADRADHLVPGELRAQRPAAARVGQRPICRGAQHALDQGRRARIGARRQHVQPRRGRVRDQHAPARSDGQPGGPHETVLVGAEDRVRRAVGRHLDHDAGQRADDQAAVARLRQRHRAMQQRAPVARHAARQRRDVAGGVDRAQRVVARVGNHDPAVAVDQHRARRVQARLRPRAVRIAGQRAAGQRRDLAIRRDRADAVVVGVGDDHAPRAVHRHAHRPVELRLRAGAVAPARHAGAGQRRHDAVGRHLADRVVAGVGDVEIARRVQRQARRRVEARRGALPVPEAFGAAGERGDTAVGAQHADAVVVAAVADVERAMRVQRESVRVGELRLRGRAISPADVAVAGQRRDVRHPVQQGRLGNGRARRRLAGRLLAQLDPPCGRDGRQQADGGRPFLLRASLHSSPSVTRGAHGTNRFARSP